MNPLDRIVAQGVRDVLEEDLGLHTYKKIEKKMNDAFGVSMLDVAGDFPKLDFVLREFFGANTPKMERRILKRIIEIDKTEESMVIIKDPNITKVIFESYGDPMKKMILDMLLKEPKSIPEAITQSKVPQASSYRRIKELIKDGLLTMAGYTKASDGRKVSKYESTFSRAKFDVQEKGLSVSVQLQKKFNKDSYALNLVSNS